jgi:hypothetical protein
MGKWCKSLDVKRKEDIMAQKYAAKLIDLIERSPNEIARQWCRDVKNNPKTPSFHSMSEDELLQIATEYYSQVRETFYANNPWEVARMVFGKYAVARYNQEVPLEEALYALILLRRHIWLYAEFQALFVSSIEQQYAVESLNRTILMFDYATHVITERYQSLLRADVEKRLGAMKNLLAQPNIKTHQYIVAGILVVASIIMIYLFHAAVNTEFIFTHLLYIPVVVSSIWFRSRGIFVAAFIAAWLLFSHFVFLGDIPIWPNVIRAGMLVFISYIIARLTEGLVKARVLT